MVFKTFKELTSFDAKDLIKELNALRQHLRGISFEHSQGLLKDTTQLKKSRRYAAWIQTIQTQREENARSAGKNR